MPPLFIDPARIRACAVSGSVIITANRRLAAQLKLAFGDAGSDPEAAPEPTPRTPAAPAAIVALDDWLQACWQDLALSGELLALTADQDLMLWERVIQQTSSHLLLRPHATARLAQAAYRNLCHWRQPISQAFYAHPDTGQFARWVKAYEGERARHGWIDPATRTRRVCDGFAEGRLAAARSIVLAGFQSLSPLLEELLGLASGNLVSAPAPNRASNIQRLACANASEEIATAAQWSQAMLASGKQRIGIIIPDLTQRRAEVERVFRAIHQPRAGNDFLAQAATAFNISASPSLAQAPLIHTALALLRLNAREIDTRELLGLLRSPFLMSPRFGAAGHLERALRRIGIPAYTRIELLQALQQVRERATADVSDPLLDGLEAFFAIAPEQTGRARSATISDWVQIFSKQLKAMHWPGSRTLDSNEYQQLQRWHQALDELAALDAILGKLTVEAALAQLNRQVTAIEFQVRSDTAPIQVLGVLEGAGLEFDVVWLMGMNDDQWPAPARPNPFIPYFIQRETGMPHATAERELELSRALFETCLRSADEVTVSHALARDDEALRPSRLVAELPGIEAKASQSPVVSPELGAYRQCYAQHPVTRLSDNEGPELRPDSKRSAGGAQLIRDQASCPFKSFVRHRLRIRELDEPAYHLTAMERGVILHRALEVLWQELLDSAALARLAPADLARQVNDAARLALRPHAARRPDLFAPWFLELEQRRLAGLLSEWLLLEQARAPFSIVATEKTVILELAGLELKLRIDRIDRLQDGHLGIVDYKTGPCSLTQWQGDRPDEPQLPLYLLTPELGKDIGMLAFARVSVDGMGWVGISAREGVAPGVSPPALIRNWTLETDWDRLQRHWQSALGDLAQAFQSGYAAVEPKNAGSCRYCKLHSLCRIGEQHYIARSPA